MCGIFGYFDNQGHRLSSTTLAAMGKVLYHRGPDGYGCYHDDVKAVAVGNRRLAIMDIEYGQQPFYSDDRQIILVQNGEIFNHIELAADLASDGYHCYTHCDTEVILRLYERDGIDAIAKLNGMFAIAIYDKRENALYLIRDRVGEKPLYFAKNNDRIVFASEIKSILQATDKASLNPNALNQFLAFNYVPPPLTMFSGIEHVMPGHWIKITEKGVEQKCWWDLTHIQPQTLSEEEWIKRFNTILDDAVKIRLRADVSFGAFLSGGVDSSSIVGLMSQHMQQPINTFCIGFDDPKYDESYYAQKAADRFNTQHEMEKVEANLLELWPLATYHCDQPHGDVSFLPMHKVASLASKKVKMVLTGDGADELFAGYDKYLNFFNDSIDDLSDEQFHKRYLDNISLFQLGQRAKLLSPAIQSNIERLNVDTFINPLYSKSSQMDRVNQALYLDVMLLLPGNNLVKPDRMGMAVSLETRAPFLDYRMIELAFSMPGNLKLQKGETKYIYKKAVTPLIGKELAYRKKQMFTVPVGEWFKTDLKEMCHDLLLSEQTQARELFDYNYVANLLNNHCDEKENNTREIRALMALEIWFRRMNLA